MYEDLHNELMWGTIKNLWNVSIIHYMIFVMHSNRWVCVKVFAILFIYICKVCQQYGVSGECEELIAV